MIKKYPSIEQFRNIVRTVRHQHDYKGKDEQGEAIFLHDSPYPTLKFKGTVKLHGTNAGIVKYADNHIEYQSRENVLSLTKDNAGFCLAMSGKDLYNLFDGVYCKEYMAVYGEWCGKDIQKGVAVSQLDKMFVVFGVKIDDQWYNDLIDSCSDNAQGIYSINQFKTFSIDIDFNNPEYSQNQLVDYTIEVENECPIGKHFGVSGIGEGIVWTCDTNSEYIFKTKGEKHSVSKVTTIAAVDTAMIEGINNFVDLAVTEQRLLQGISVLKENGTDVDQKATGDFLRWVVNDVVKEEGDTIIANQYDVKKVNSTVSNKARLWFLNYINTNY